MKLLLILLAFALAGCTTCPTPTPPAPIVHTIDTGCTWAKPFQVSPQDTAETKRAALKAWTTYFTICGKT